MSMFAEKLEALADKAKEWHERTRDWGKWTMPNTVLAMLEDWEKSVAALLADNAKEGEPGLRELEQAIKEQLDADEVNQHFRTGALAHRIALAVRSARPAPADPDGQGERITMAEAIQSAKQIRTDAERRRREANKREMAEGSIVSAPADPDALREALRKYGQHRESCELTTHAMGHCTCGFDLALGSPRKE